MGAHRRRVSCGRQHRVSLAPGSAAPSENAGKPDRDMKNFLSFQLFQVLTTTRQFCLCYDACVEMDTQSSRRGAKRSAAVVSYRFRQGQMGDRTRSKIKNLEKIFIFPVISSSYHNTPVLFVL